MGRGGYRRGKKSLCLEREVTNDLGQVTEMKLTFVEPPLGAFILFKFTIASRGETKHKGWKMKIT
jgi:hypothetical protein